MPTPLWPEQAGNFPRFQGEIEIAQDDIAIEYQAVEGDFHANAQGGLIAKRVRDRPPLLRNWLGLRVPLISRSYAGANLIR